MRCSEHVVATPVGDLKPLRAFEGVALKATREAQKNKSRWNDVVSGVCVIGKGTETVTAR